MVRITVLASGSKGNCAVVASSTTRILVDAGLSCREILNRMRQTGEDPEALSAIVITHEHADHIGGLKVLARKLKVPVYMTGPTHKAWFRLIKNEAKRADREARDLERLEFFEAGHNFQIGNVTIMPFTIPHDAVDPVGFTFKVDGVKVGIVTDLGYITPNVKEHIRACDILMIESNHDVEMLKIGPYPWSVKQRILDRTGHLSNDALAEFFRKDYDGGAAFLILAHLSEQNNLPEIARMVAERALGRHASLFQHRLLLALQSQPLESLTL
ncbi:MAG TPA: MBL fold metallo-hydrolase [Terriglobales bacterium]|jgi:phosphoribosyl 1,2-cyclic phosphodiesterase|nr:MBL fold metallo-hydrolase [Terriglobales bacterium]